MTLPLDSAESSEVSADEEMESEDKATRRHSTRTRSAAVRASMADPPSEPDSTNSDDEDRNQVPGSRRSRHHKRSIHGAAGR